MAVCTYEEIAGALGLDAAGAKIWAPGWEASQALLPAEPLFFLQADFVREVVALSGLSQAGAEALQAGAAAVRGSEAFCRLAWHLHWRKNLAGPDDGDLPSVLPGEGVALPGNNPHLFTLVTLGRLPGLRRYYAARGIGEEVLRDTLHDLAVWTETGHERKGVLACFNWAWLTQGLMPTLFALGRLEFQFGRWDQPLRVYRGHRSGRICLLLPGNLGVSAASVFASNPGEPALWQTEWREGGGEVCGHAVGDNGRIERVPVTLPLQEWEAAVSLGDPVLNLHIPAGAPLTPESCRDSLDRAWVFFPKHFPEFKFKLLRCGSWLFDPQLAAYLPASNIAAFQRFFRLYPLPEGTGWQTRQRVFGDPDLSLAQAPQKTRLQKLVKEHLDNGGFWHSGGALAFPGE